ncbi:TetR/AcrR family transcriptional regulator [Luteococcus japonicus]|uniref:TetR/AcrR family transcriptional regulator n=1 Tax=Luteococcus japonicus TaxID=33984 RepID=UPI002118999E|nr:TetR/AcrR family transcriptional regulator [Luteococcus japonicus]
MSPYFNREGLLNADATTRAPRRDVQRNRAKIIDAARAAFAQNGLEAPLDAIAKAAGVGAGTLYRHFPTREDLVAAVLEEHRPDLAREAQRIAHQDHDPQRALDEWLDAIAGWMRAYEGLPAPLRAALDATGTPLGTTCERVIETTSSFLAPVQEAGQARSEITGRDLFLSVLATTWATAAQPSNPEPRLGRMLRHGWLTTEPHL